MSCIQISEFSAYLGRDFFAICDLSSFTIIPIPSMILRRKKYVNRLLKQLIITDYIESVNGFKKRLPHLRKVSPIVEK